MNPIVVIALSFSSLLIVTIVGITLILFTDSRARQQARRHNQERNKREFETWLDSLMEERQDQ